MTDRRVVCWFSCGAASAVATKLVLNESPKDVVVAYCDTGAEHSDNERFLSDCEQWFGVPVVRLKSDTYSDIWDVFRRTRYLVGTKGARCTVELKKRVRQAFEQPDDLQVFGYTSDERKRAARLSESNFELSLRFPLIDGGISKERCLSLIAAAGIEIPAMYRLGYRNNNCVGCVKGQSGYWNKIRIDFPEVFDRMAKVERELDVAICKTETGGVRQRVFLDELPRHFGRTPEPMNCDFLCGDLLEREL